jgi:hypothetical protein
VLDGVDYAEKKSTFVRRVLAEQCMRIVALEPMTDDAVPRTSRRSPGRTRAARAAADHVSLDAAERFVRAQYAALLPDGPRTPGHRFFRSRVDGVGRDRGARVAPRRRRRRAGVRVRHHDRPRPSPSSIRHERAHVGRVHRARRRLCDARLNVFADNPGALALYHILGFQTVSRHLNKVIRDGG